MRPGLEIGDTAQFAFTVGEGQLVPNMIPQIARDAGMPGVLATGYMIGLMEWACVAQMQPFMEPGEGSLGVHVDVSHIAATPPGLTVTVTTRLESVEGRFLWFHVSAHDGVDIIGEGRHKRALARWDTFTPRAMAKAPGAKERAETGNECYDAGAASIHVHVKKAP